MSEKDKMLAGELYDAPAITVDADIPATIAAQMLNATTFLKFIIYFLL